MSLLVAVFLIVIFVIRINWEKATGWAINFEREKRSKDIKEKYLEWESRVLLTNDDRLKLMQMPYQERTNRSNEMKKRAFSEASLELDELEAYLASIAKEGKIPIEHIMHGFKTKNDLSDGVGAQKRQRKFLIWYNKILKEHNIDEPLLFCPNSKINELRSTRDISIATPIMKSKLEQGIYFWEPSIFWF